MTKHAVVAHSCEIIPQYVLDAIKSGPELLKLKSFVEIDGQICVRDTTEIDNEDLTQGEKLVRWAEECLVVPEGPLVGEPLQLDIYQKVFILSVFDNPAVTSKAMMSIARRNGKTFLVAVILLGLIIGPLRSLNTSICSGANARDQAAIAFDLMKTMLIMSPEVIEGVHYSYTESSKTIVGLRVNCKYKAISADGKTGHGKAYKVILLDEAGQIEAESTSFTDMLETSMSNYDDALYLIISTQAPSDSSYFSQQLDHAEIEQDPTIVSHVYSADKGCDLMDPDQWQKANPGLGKFVSLKKMAQKANEARQLPSKANGIMNLNYNMRVSQQSLMMSPEVWKSNLRPINEITRKTAPIDIGLDLSKVSDLTAAVASWRDDNGDINCETHAFAPSGGVESRELRDKVPYQRFATQGTLQLTPGPSVDYQWVAEYLAIKFKGCKIRSIQFDRYRIDLFKEAAKKTDLYPMVGEWVEVGQGFISMGIRVDAFEREALVGKLRTNSHPLFNLGISHAIVAEDPAGNRKCMKNKSTQKIDVVIAALMSVFPNSDGQVNANAFDVDAMIG